MGKEKKKSSTSYIYKLFPKDFLRPYGEASEKFSATVFKKKLKPWSCELLRRPGVGVSQFADTITKNFGSNVTKSKKYVQ